MAPTDTNTKPRGGAEPVLREDYAEALAEARERTLALVAPVSQGDLDRVHSPLMSPLVWDLGHIAAFEDLWLCVRAGGLEPLRPDLMAVYDASETPRAERGDIPYLRRDDALEYMEQVRERALGVLAGADLSPDSDRLNANGFVWDLLIQHEHQHNETMLQTLQLAEPGVFVPDRIAGSRVAGTTTGHGGPSSAAISPGSAHHACPPAILDDGAVEIGDVWEWTASDFAAWPGFESFPYAEYSEAFFGADYRVLRGGSWATRPGAVRNTFRNWDYPIRRQIFSGFRCARDA